MDSLLIKNVTKHIEVREKLKKIDFFNKNEYYKNHVYVNPI